MAKAIEEIRDTQYAPTFYNDEQAMRYVIKFAYIAAVDQNLKIEELPSGKGIADVVYLPKRRSLLPALVVELKWNKSSEGAIQQIRERNYPAVLKDHGGEVVIVGISYDLKKKEHSCVIERVTWWLSQASKRRQDMNLTQFMKEVDRASENMAQEKMAAFLHSYAPSISEEKREAFLKLLVSFTDKNMTAKDVLETDAQNRDQIKQQIEENKRKLEHIVNEEWVLSEILNEEYDDWHDDIEEFYYEDPENIGGAIEEGCRLVHTCVDLELYREGYELADLLLTIEVVAEGEYGENQFSLRELAQEKIITLDYKGFVLESLIAAYCGNPLHQRPDALYRIFSNANCGEVSLEMLMQQSGSGMDQSMEFLELWIDHLGTREGRMENLLLEEAVLLADDAEILLRAARKYVSTHPELYLYFLKHCMENRQGQEGMEIGLEALKKIPAPDMTGSQIALLTSEFALQSDKGQCAEGCWLEAFRFNADVANYLRLFLECVDFTRYQDETEAILQSSFPKYEKKDIFSLAPASRIYHSLQFFYGRFKQLMEEGMDPKQGLGWSATFMKEGIALLLMFLYEGEDLASGGREMCRKYVSSIAFKAEEYLKGTGRGTELDDQKFFWECFCKWRKRTVISEKEVQDIITQLEKWIQLRVEGIMEKNHRQYYGECAALVAALGEVKESRGEPFGKRNTMEQYREKYSRRRAFHDELRAYGMKDPRKRK